MGRVKAHYTDSRLTFIPKELSDKKIVLSNTESVYSGQHLTPCRDYAWSTVRQIRPERDFCCGSNTVDSCARQKPLPHITVESWVSKGAALESFQLGMARAFSCMSHYPLKLLPFLLIRLNLSALANLVIQALCKWNWLLSVLCRSEISQPQEFISLRKKNIGW